MFQVDQNAALQPPEPGERGWKDTVIAYPGQVTRVRMRFGTAGQYVWHCHIVSHEDNEMMRPFQVVRRSPARRRPWRPGTACPDRRAAARALPPGREPQAGQIQPSSLNWGNTALSAISQ